MTEQRKERCETCRFWDLTTKWTPITSPEPDPEAECKRFPPSRCFYDVDDPAMSCYWEGPARTASDWCGEWQPTGETPPVKRCPQLLHEGDARDLLCTLSARIRRWTKSGILPSVQLPDGEIRFLEADLAEWIDKHRQPANPGDNPTTPGD